VTETYEISEFARLALEKFGKKVTFANLVPPNDEIDKINSEFHCNLTAQDFIDYGKHVWITELKCPNCDANLSGSTPNSFEWHIRHGEGFCNNCNEVRFQVYHFIGKERIKMTGWELVSF
jgi:hypothetical protein